MLYIINIGILKYAFCFNYFKTFYFLPKILFLIRDYIQIVTFYIPKGISKVIYYYSGSQILVCVRISWVLIKNIDSCFLAQAYRISIWE